MTNPNKVIFSTRMTTSNFICDYTYSSGSGMVQPDFDRMVEIYGVENVSMVRKGSKITISVSQPIYISAEDMEVE